MTFNFAQSWYSPWQFKGDHCDLTVSLRNTSFRGRNRYLCTVRSDVLMTIDEYGRERYLRCTSLFSNWYAKVSPFLPISIIHYWAFRSSRFFSHIIRLFIKCHWHNKIYFSIIIKIIKSWKNSGLIIRV